MTSLMVFLQINDPETPVNGNTIYTTPSKVKMERRQRTSRTTTTSPLVPPLLRSTEKLLLHERVTTSDYDDYFEGLRL